MTAIYCAHLFRLQTPPLAVTGLVSILLMPVTASAQSTDATPPIIAAFETATHDYALMHRRLERQIGSIQPGTPVAEINRIIQELAAAIRAERRDAKQGDLFAPGVAALIRTRINEALLEDGFTANDVRAAARVDAVDYERLHLKVNDTFPWVLAAAMFPCVIEALPALPPELQYRLVGDDLVLIDMHASLIVDILPRALIDMTARE